MSEYIRQIRSVFVSLRLTVVLLALSIVLVFWATLDQVHLGVWAVQQKFFHSLFVTTRVGDLLVPVYPGGYLIGGLLLVNLLSAHIYRFKAGWRKSGIWIAHAGLILLLVGELISGIVQQDFSMRLDEGQTKNYSESNRLNELAVIDATDPNFDDVVAIPESLLARGEDAQRVLENLSQSLTNKLLHPPTQALSGADATERAQVLELLARIYQINKK